MLAVTFWELNRRLAVPFCCYRHRETQPVPHPPPKSRVLNQVILPRNHLPQGPWAPSGNTCGCHSWEVLRTSGRARPGTLLSLLQRGVRLHSQDHPAQGVMVRRSRKLLTPGQPGVVWGRAGLGSGGRGAGSRRCIQGPGRGVGGGVGWARDRVPANEREEVVPCLLPAWPVRPAQCDPRAAADSPVPARA